MRDEEIESMKQQVDWVQWTTDSKLRSYATECKLLERAVQDKEKRVKVFETHVSDKYDSLK